jgi:hypothetical protein
MRILLLLRVVLRSDLKSRASETARVFGINSMELTVKVFIRLSNAKRRLSTRASKANKGCLIRNGQASVTCTYPLYWRVLKDDMVLRYLRSELLKPCRSRLVRVTRLLSKYLQSSQSSKEKYDRVRRRCACNSC